MTKKYILTDDYVNNGYARVYRIKALRSFGAVKAGDLGGFVESENNLSHDGDCWVSDDAVVRGNARVLDNAIVGDNAVMYGEAWASGNAEVVGNAVMYGDASVAGDDKLTSKAINIINWCQFNITASYKDQYMRIGCKSHSFEFWRNYIDSNSKEYLADCGSIKEHQRCVCIINCLLAGA